MDDRIIRVERAVENMANGIAELTKAIGDVLQDNAVRNERDKHHEESHLSLAKKVDKANENLEADLASVNKKVNDFIESYKDHDKPVIDTSRKWQSTAYWWLTRVIAPSIIVSLLYVAGAPIYDKAKSKHEAVKVR